MASNTKYHFVTGPVLFARVFEETKDMGNGGKVDYTKEEGMYSVEVVLTEEQKAEMIGYGVQEKALGNIMFKTDQDGNPKYRFKRPHKHKTMKDRKTGAPVVFGAPEVFDMEKALAAWKEAGTGTLQDHIKPWSYEEDGNIGNGSICKIKYSVYQGSNGSVVVRLEKVAVIERLEPEGSDPETADADSAYF